MMRLTEAKQDRWDRQSAINRASLASVLIRFPPSVFMVDGARMTEPPHPKAVRYTEVSDDDFFGKFDPPARTTRPKKEDDGPLTLDDIFGENGMFTDDRKGGKR